MHRNLNVPINRREGERLVYQGSSKFRLLQVHYDVWTDILSALKGEGSFVLTSEILFSE